MKDAFHDNAAVASLAPAVVTATTKGSHVDLQGYGSALLLINTGAVVGDGDYSIAIQHSDTTTDGDFADVTAADLLGTLPASLEADMAYQQGYIGRKRYVRAVITKTGGTSIAAGAVFVLGHPALAPVA